MAYPTEYCYGLGCNPTDQKAVRRILRLKRRSWAAGLIIIAADLRQLTRLVDLSDELLLDAPRSSWPGPHTWLLPALPGTPKWIRGQHHTVAVRVTAHPVAKILCQRFGSAIVSTSANRHGRAPLRTAGRVHNEFGDGVDFILEGQIGTASAPSSIHDAQSGQIIRPS